VGGSTAWQSLANLPDPSGIPDEEPTGVRPLNELVSRGLEQVRGEFETKTWQSFWRTAVDGLATAVVAEQLGLTPAAVRQNRSRVLRRLRQQLGDV
jgi:RNA polymerase sigma-70 factor (ECF subfamily)